MTRALFKALFCTTLCCCSVACIQLPAPTNAKPQAGDMDMVDADMTANVDMGPCGPCASGAVCDPVSKSCVGCLTENECGGSTPYCINNACVECGSDAATSCTEPERPHCVDAKCVECGAHSDCADPTKPACIDGVCGRCSVDNNACQSRTDFTRCDAISGKCVECNDNVDCPDADKSLCVDGVCTGCSVADDCVHIAGAKACDVPNKTCVACLPATEGTDCNERSCDPKTLTCTNTRLKTLGACQPCVSDRECFEDHKCIPMTFRGEDIGAFCLGSFSKGCAPPYTIKLGSRTSVNSTQVADYCGVAEMQTTCMAVLDRLVSKPCTGPLDDQACGEADLADGLCKDLKGGANGFGCTYTCGTNDDCPPGRACSAAHFCE